MDDAGLDPTLPDAASWEQLEAYLHEHEAVPNAISAAKCVWEQYEKQPKAKLKLLEETNPAELAG